MTYSAHYGASYAQVYDRIFPASSGEPAARFIDAILPDGSTVLELGAGSGRIARALAQLGHDVVGIDIAEAMLEKARAKPAVGPGRIEYRHSDMRALPHGLQADLVLSALGSLCCLHQSEDRLAMFRAARKTVDSDKFFIAEIFNPEFVMEFHQQDGPVKTVVTDFVADGAVLTSQYAYAAGESRWRVSHSWDGPGERLRFGEDVALPTVTGLAQEAEVAGWALSRVFADWAGNDAGDSEPPMLILVFKAIAGASQR